MAVTIICPNLQCGKTMVAEEHQRGRVVRCVHCQKALMVPAPREEAYSLPPAPSEKSKKGR